MLKIIELKEFNIEYLIKRYSILFISILLFLIFSASINFGAISISLGDFNLFKYIYSDTKLTGSAYVLWNLRLPRAILAILIGAALGLSGALTQGLFRNPLSDPGLLGVTSGAACAAALSIVIFGNENIIPPFLKPWILPLSAFIGAISVCYLLDRISKWIAADSIAGLLLTGIAFNALAASIIGLTTFLATDEQLRTLTFWTLGSLAGSNWIMVASLFLILVISLIFVRKIIDFINALALGENTALHIGVDVKTIRVKVMIFVALLCGISVAWCGIIGFIGLIAPHIVRCFYGPDNKYVIPYSMFVGGILLLVADTVSRTIAIPTEIPVGIFTALLGSPFFMFLLLNARKRYR